MKSGVVCLMFFASVLTLLSRVLCYSYGRDEHPSLEERVDRLEDKVDILTNEMDKLISKNLDENQGESTQQSGVTVLEVRREYERLWQMVRFTVKYLYSGEGTVETRWLEYSWKEEHSGINTAVGDGVYETSSVFPYSPSPDDNTYGNRAPSNSIWLALELPDYNDLTLGLYLSDKEAVQREIPTPQLEIVPAGDFVYQEGEDFSFKMRTTSPGEDRPSSGKAPRLYMSAILLDPLTGKASLTHKDDFIQIGEKKKFQNYEEEIFRIKGTDKGVSGLVHFMSMMDIDSNVLYAVQSTKLVNLRPSTQEGPFPDGYLGFMERSNDMIYVGANGGDEFVCKLDEDCHYECMVAGNDIVNVSVRRLKADGSEQILTGNELGRILPNLRRIEVTFNVDSIPEEPDRILCVADNAQGTSISKEVSISVSTPVAIIGEDSRIVMVSRDENKAVFEIACTVKGLPQPNVTFSIYGSHSQFGVEPDVTIERGDDTYTMIKTVTYDIEDVDRSWFSLTADCSADRVHPYWGTDYYSMTFGSNNETYSLSNLNFTLN